MADYDSKHVNQPGQYPTEAWTRMGLPEQDFGSGAAGTARPFDNIDAGGTNQPGQYPSADPFTGVSYDGFQPAGSQGAGFNPAYSGGGDSVTFDDPTLYKSAGSFGDATFDDDGAGENKGYRQHRLGMDVSQWTEANPEGYDARDALQMPGITGNHPVPGSGQYQTDGLDGSGHVMWGGFRRGQRPPTDRHPTVSGPGT